MGCTGMRWGGLGWDGVYWDGMGVYWDEMRHTGIGLAYWDGMQETQALDWGCTGMRLGAYWEQSGAAVG